MDSTIVVAGISGVSGIVVGFAGGWFTRPAAQGKVNEEALKRQQQRKVIADARQMVAEATQKNLPKHALATDPRLLAIASRLDEGVMNAYKFNPMPAFTTPVLGKEIHTPLLRTLTGWNESGSCSSRRVESCVQQSGVRIPVSVSLP